MSGLRLDSYEAFTAAWPAIKNAVVSRRMPPFLAANCCSELFDDRSLTDAQIELVRRFIDAGLAKGEPSTSPPQPPPRRPLPHVDVTLRVPAPYQPTPELGSTDDNRCFALDWPLERSGFVTGLSPRPGNRQLVHHLIVAALTGSVAQEAKALDEADPLPGFSCNGGLGRFNGAIPIGGSLVGGQLPRGLGTEVSAGSVLLVNIHYSVARADAEGVDQTEIDFMVEPQARKASAVVMANPAWLVGDAMRVPAGEADVPFFFRFRPTLFTGGKRVMIEGVSPHMHAFGKRLAVRIIRKSGERVCLLEIPRWEFGWEQPFWLAQPVELAPEDELYLECRFDNSDQNQPSGRAPRDFAWGGNDQDMCAALVTFTAVP